MSRDLAQALHELWMSMNAAMDQGHNHTIRVDPVMVEDVMAAEAVVRKRDGNRPLPYDRDHLGRLVREAWVRWAYTQPNPKPSWLLDYDELSEPDKEADRQIGECIARWTIIGDAARAALAPSPAGREG